MQKDDPTKRTWGLKIGDGFVRDLMNPKVEELDLSAIRERLWATRRFTNNPKALTVGQHVVVVQQIAMTLLQHPKELHDDVMFWCLHHDDHEGILGDIPGPLKNLIAAHTSILSVIEGGIDIAICRKHDRNPPTGEVRAIVHDYDKMAETMEWIHVLGEQPEPWNYPMDPSLTPEVCRSILKGVGHE